MEPTPGELESIDTIASAFELYGLSGTRLMSLLAQFGAMGEENYRMLGAMEDSDFNFAIGVWSNYVHEDPPSIMEKSAARMALRAARVKGGPSPSAESATGARGPVNLES